MSCASCAATVRGGLGGAAGVATASVNYATARAAVSYDDAHTNVAELIRTVRAAGYDCGKASVTFGVEQLHYAPSVAPLEQALGRLKGVLRAAANQARSEEHTSELQSRLHLVCRLLLEKKKKKSANTPELHDVPQHRLLLVTAGMSSA